MFFIIIHIRFDISESVGGLHTLTHAAAHERLNDVHAVCLATESYEEERTELQSKSQEVDSIDEFMVVLEVTDLLRRPPYRIFLNFCLSLRAGFGLPIYVVSGLFQQ